MFMKSKASSISSAFLLIYSCLILPITYHFVMNEMSILLEWNIILVSSCTMTMNIILDTVSLSFSNVVCLISGCVMLFSSSYMANDPFLKRFIWLVMLFVMSMNLLVFIPSLPALLLGWDGLGIVSFALVIYYQNMKSLGAGLLTILANRIGDVMILISIAIMVLQGHWIILIMWDPYLLSWLTFTILIAAMTKSAQIPFSAWLPAAMAAPTPVSALVHSSTLATVGVSLSTRFSSLSSKTNMFQPVLLFISVLTLLMAGIVANHENDLKKIAALSTLGQLGMMMMALGMNMMSLSLFHLYAHALFKALLVLCTGMIILNGARWQDTRSVGLVFMQAPLTITSMNIANLPLCEAPFLSSFYAKDLILGTSLTSPTRMVMNVLIFTSTGMSVAYTLRLSFCSLWTNMKNYPMHMKVEKDDFINTSTSILAIPALVAGAFTQSSFLKFSPPPFIMPMSHKMLTHLVIIGGLFMGYILWEADFTPKKMNETKFFLATKWFLAPISSQPLTKSSMDRSTNMMKSIDQGWLEILGGQGSFKPTSNQVAKNDQFQIKTTNLITFNIFIMSMLILLSMKF
uniref:NADH-ubiquinone oxidoreductase chain 5 n=1 Tax=Godlewskia godlewskia TaxID=96615 RepID=A0A248RGC1_9CAEN|nr:NADH dehydrogenase subunit 5 [Godlewskia godlewskia]ASU96528.1 NADH dehydrogenase subunit 5 [Godlewskia godlewskia]